MKKKNIDSFLLLFLFLLVIFLRLPLVFRPFDLAYENFIAFWGREVVNGGGFYSTPWTFKPPGEAIVYGLFYLCLGVGKWALGLRIFSLILGGLTAVLIYKLGKKLFGFLAGFIASLIYIIFSSRVDVFVGTMAYAEMWMPFFSLLGYLFFFMAQEKKMSKFFFFSGLSLGISFLFKQSALYDFLPLFFFALFNGYLLYRDKKEKLKKIISDLLIFVLGLALPMFIFFFWMIFTGRFGLLWSWMVEKTVIYSKIREKHPGDYLIGIYKKTYPVVVLGFLGIVTSFLTRKSKKFLFVLWFITTFLIFISSGKFWNYYFNQPFIPLCFLAGILAQDIFNLIKRRWAWFVMLLIIFFVSFTNLSYYRFYFSHFNDFLSRKITKSEYINSLSEGSSWTIKKQVADFIDQNVLPSEKVFIMSDSPALYVLSDKKPPFREFLYKQQFFENKTIGFAFMNPLETYDGNKKNLVEKMEKTPPDFIVLTEEPLSEVFSEIESFPQFFSFVFANYEFSQRYGNIWIYRLKKEKIKPVASLNKIVVDFIFAYSYFKVVPISYSSVRLEPLAGGIGNLQVELVNKKNINYFPIKIISFKQSNQDFLTQALVQPSGVNDLLLKLEKPSKKIKNLSIKNSNFLWAYPTNGINAILSLVEDKDGLTFYFEPFTSSKSDEFELYIIFEDNSVGLSFFSL